MFRCARRILLLASAGLTLVLPMITRAHPGTEVAIADLTSLIANCPANPELHVRRALCYVEHARWPEALADLTAAGQLAPNHPGLALAWAEYHSAHGDRPAAIKTLDLVLRADPNDIAALIVRARALAAEGQRTGALADFSHALALLLEPKPELWLEANALQSDPAAALADLDLGIARLGPAPALVERALDLELRLHRTDAALARLAQLAAAAERPEFFLKRRGDLLRSVGRSSEALDDYARALAALDRLPDWLRASESNRLLSAQLAALISLST